MLSVSESPSSLSKVSFPTPTPPCPYPTPPFPLLLTCRENPLRRPYLDAILVLIRRLLRLFLPPLSKLVLSASSLSSLTTSTASFVISLSSSFDAAPCARIGRSSCSSIQDASAKPRIGSSTILDSRSGRSFWTNEGCRSGFPRLRGCLRARRRASGIKIWVIGAVATAHLPASRSAVERASHVETSVDGHAVSHATASLHQLPGLMVCAVRSAGTEHSR